MAMNRNSTQPGASGSSSGGGNELLCKIKYLNTLPDIPFDPKFIAYPFDPNRFIKYNSTSLEKNFKWDILNEQDLGVRIDLVNPDTHKSDPYAKLDEADEKLLEEETISAADVKRIEQHNKSVAWLRRNEYISSENTRFQPRVYDQAESKVGYSIKRKLSQLEFYKDRESQIRAIEKSFAAAKQPIDKHFSKQGVYPVQEMQIFPDFELWRHTCAQVIFDTAPSVKGRLPQVEEMSQAVIRGMIDENNEQFVAYFLPTEETIAKRRRDDQNNVDYEPDEDYNYKLAHEYTWSLKNKSSSGYEENYYFTMKDNGVFYNELETRVRLNKRRANKSGKISNTRLVVKYRDFNEAELKQQRSRMRGLETLNEEEEEEEDDDEEDEGGLGGGNNDTTLNSENKSDDGDNDNNEEYNENTNEGDEEENGNDEHGDDSVDVNESSND